MFQYQLKLDKNSSVMMSILGYGEDNSLNGADINLHLYIDSLRCGSNRFYADKSTLVPNVSATCVVPLSKGSYVLTYQVTSSSSSLSNQRLHMRGDLVVN